MTATMVLDQHHLARLTAILTKMQDVAYGVLIKEYADMVLRESFETIFVDGVNVCLSKKNIRESAKKQTHDISKEKLKAWLATDPESEKHIEEYVVVNKGWGGYDLYKMLKECFEYAVIKCVYDVIVAANSDIHSITII